MTSRIAGFRGEFLWELEIATRQSLAMAEAIPQEMYDWRPDIKARSVSEVFVHVATGNFRIPYFRMYDLRSTNATRRSAGGVADEWVIQMLRQGDSQVFKKYSQMKLQMKREALDKINRRANEMSGVLTH
jgi:hypothetical protein